MTRKKATVSIVRDFVKAAVSHLCETLNAQSPEWQVDSRWERGSDGDFRERTKRMLWPTWNPAWLRALPGYSLCVDHLKSDPIIGLHLDRLVGTNTTASSVTVDDILRSAISAMYTDEGSIAFTEERFNRKWRELSEFFKARQIAFKMVAPLPHLAVSDFPLRLNKELVLDRLTADEVTRCCQVGVLQPQSPRFPLIEAEVAVGVRRTIFLPKLVWTGEETSKPPQALGEGSFGNRPPLREDLIVADVLSALRLFRHTQVRTAGYASWTDFPRLNAGTSYRVLRQWPYGGKYELSEGEIPQFLELWHLLEEGAARFGFSIRRFNLAFDRELLDDRIVDLIIAAESLLLGDLDTRDRGELRFRFALRAAKFLEHPHYDEHDIFRVMRRAYDARSAIVHGGSPKDIRLLNNHSTTLPTFTEVIEELVRLGLRKGISMKEDGKKLRHAEHWENLVLSKSERADFQQS